MEISSKRGYLCSSAVPCRRPRVNSAIARALLISTNAPRSNYLPKAVGILTVPKPVVRPVVFICDRTHNGPPIQSVSKSRSSNPRSGNKMKKLLWICFLASFTLGTARGQNGTSTSPQGAVGIYSGSAVCASSASGLTPSIPTCIDSAANNGLWFTVMNASVKTSTTTDLFISPSLVTGLYTETQVKGSSSGTSQTSAATGSVAVRVLIDCSMCATPGTAQSGSATYTAAAQPDPNGTGVVFDARIQQLTATLGQVITSTCLTANNCTNHEGHLLLFFRRKSRLKKGRKEERKEERKKERKKEGTKCQKDNMPLGENYCGRRSKSPGECSKLTQKLLRLAERYGVARLDAACRRALDFDLLDGRSREFPQRSGATLRRGRPQPAGGKRSPSHLSTPAGTLPSSRATNEFRDIR